jgi:hypothetical protein
MNPKPRGVQMKTGDLVRVISEWTYYNPWMVFLTEDQIGLVVAFPTTKMARVYIGGEEVMFKRTELQVINESR